MLNQPFDIISFAMAKKRLGQNFLFDPSILRKIIDAANLAPDDTVVEIGPGHGKMTAMIAERVSKVIAIELDGQLYERLIRNLSEYKNIEVVHGDALEYSYDIPDGFKVVANIPYYITTPIIFKLLEFRDRLKSITITLQKDVAERIVASPGGKDYGALSIVLQYYGKPEFKFIVPGGAFRPVPKVDSAVIHIELYDTPQVSVRDENFFFRVVKTAFSQRRKTIYNALRGLCPDTKEKLLGLDIDPMRRPETLSSSEFALLSDALLSSVTAPSAIIKKES